jgi:hypothetical protein
MLPTCQVCVALIHDFKFLGDRMRAARLPYFFGEWVKHWPNGLGDHRFEPVFGQNPILGVFNCDPYPHGVWNILLFRDNEDMNIV